MGELLRDKDGAGFLRGASEADLLFESDEHGIELVADPVAVNAVSVKAEDGTYLVTVGGSNAKTAQYLFDETHFLLLIVEYAQASGITLPTLFEEPEAKPWTPWVVKKEQRFGD